MICGIVCHPIQQVISEISFPQEMKLDGTECTNIYKEIRPPSYPMQLIDHDGKIFGKINLLDSIIGVFLLSIITAIFVYTYFPPTVNQHSTLTFQVYYKNSPLGVLDLFQIGNELEVHNIGDRAIVTHVKILSDYFCFDPASFDVIVTYNGTLEVGPNGQYLFNDFEISPGKELHGQINSFFVYGIVYRVNTTNISTQKLITLSVPDNLLINITGDIYDNYNQKVGTILSIEPSNFKVWNVTGMFMLDVYKDALYFMEKTPVNVNTSLGFHTKNGTIKGIVISIENVTQNEDENH